jgi:hypothetical protein
VCVEVVSTTSLAQRSISLKKSEISSAVARILVARAYE